MVDSQDRKIAPVVPVLKSFLACIPVSIVVYGLKVRSHSIIGLSLIAGVLLQALIPPRKKGLLLLLSGSVLYTLIYFLLGR